MKADIGVVNLRRKKPRRPKRRGVEEILCKDGTVKRVHHDVADEFALYFADHKAKYDATVQLLQQAKLNGSRDVDTRLATLTYELDEVNRSLMLGFRAHYELYKTDPCSMHARFVAAVEGLLHYEQRARYFYGTLDRVLQYVQAGVPPDQAFLLLDKLGTPLELSAPVTDLKIREASNIVDRWADVDGESDDDNDGEQPGGDDGGESG